LGGALGVLAFAVGIQFVDPIREEAAPRPPHLSALFPEVLPGWQVRDLPLGATEYQSEVVSRVLNYDDVLYREYRRGEVRFAVYVAYWGAGRMPVRLVASHTPDRCWTENGWQCTAMRFDERIPLGDGMSAPGDWRRFRDPNGDTMYVIFWHLIDGEVHDYGERFNAVPHPLEWWKDAIDQAMHGSREQYFVRLTANVPLESLWHEPGIRSVVDRLRELGLAAKMER